MTTMTNCVNCNFASSFHLVNRKGNRICPDCLQKEYDKTWDNLERAFMELYNAVKKNENYVAEIQTYAAVLDQIKGLTELVKEITT
jgi:hypothetical protein